MFPATRYSAIVRLRADDEGERRLAWDALVSAYWRPVYKYLRARWRLPAEHAEDLTQEFFARAFEQGFLDRLRSGEGAVPDLAASRPRSPRGERGEGVAAAEARRRRRR